MALNKNQHYVPQCYLRQFSCEESEAAIFVYNLDKKKLIPNAPIKNQCSKNYFYGSDLKLEKALQPIEGRYSNLIKKVCLPNYKPNKDDNEFFLDFWLLQYLRTEAASRRLVEMAEGFVSVTGVDEFKIQLDDAIQQSMQAFSEAKNYVMDMKVCIFRNKTKNKFYTSDDPAILTNRWHFIDKRANGHTFGLSSGGNIFILPLTPKLLFLAYDPNVYSILSKNQWVDVKSNNDVDALNSLQFINCRANIYTESNLNQSNIDYLHQSIVSIRPSVKHRITCAVLDKVSATERRYKVVSKNEVTKDKDTLIHCQPIQTSPHRWPSQIRWKHKGFVLTNGSDVGFIRKNHAERYDVTTFYKVMINK